MFAQKNLRFHVDKKKIIRENNSIDDYIGLNTCSHHRFVDVILSSLVGQLLCTYKYIINLTQNKTFHVGGLMRLLDEIFQFSFGAIVKRKYKQISPILDYSTAPII